MQDCLFASDLLVFQARLLARTPRPAQAVVDGGLVDLEAELGWFEEKAAEREPNLEIPRPERAFWEMAWSGGGGG